MREDSMGESDWNDDVVWEDPRLGLKDYELRYLKLMREREKNYNY